MVRGVVVVLLGALLAFQALRVAAVRDSGSALAARLWPSHPNVLLHQTMTAVGDAAARSQSLGPDLLAQIEVIARKSPLAPEPFLIHGALAQLNRRDDAAEQLFKTARLREPRSEAARYFLADRYLRTGKTSLALTEMAVLSRLIPEASVQYAPALAAYARSPGAIPELKRFFRSSPEFEPSVLVQLGADARNTDLIFALWSGKIDEEARPDWRSILVAELVEQGDYARARQVWTRVSGVPRDGSALFNAEFAESSAPPPFNWTYGSQGGFSEPLGDGRLQVMYYGREDAVLAEQLLVLGPGRYALSFAATGNLKSGAEIQWQLACLGSDSTILSAPIASERSSARFRAEFAVPTGCRAQRLRLTASPGELPASADLTVSELAIGPVR